MNSNIVATSPLLAAAAAFLILLVSPVTAGFIVTVTGVLSFLVLDYGCPRDPVSLPAETISFGSTDRSLSGFREAA